MESCGGQSTMLPGNALQQQAGICCVADLEDALSLQRALVSLLVLDPSKEQLSDLGSAAHIHELGPRHLP